MSDYSWCSLCKMYTEKHGQCYTCKIKKLESSLAAKDAEIADLKLRCGDRTHIDPKTLDELLASPPKPDAFQKKECDHDGYLSCRECGMCWTRGAKIICGDRPVPQRECDNYRPENITNIFCKNCGRAYDAHNHQPPRAGEKCDCIVCEKRRDREGD